LLDPPGDGLQTSRSLGMTDARVVIEEDGMGAEKNGHPVEVTGRARPRS
jgi:hypothetical protein